MANDGKQNLRFRLACRMLRNAGHLDAEKALPGQRLGESMIDYFVRCGIARDKFLAAEMLIVGRGLQNGLNELVSMPDIAFVLNPALASNETVEKPPTYTHLP